jgi:hypothetical protein
VRLWCEGPVLVLRMRADGGDESLWPGREQDFVEEKLKHEDRVDEDVVACEQCLERELMCQNTTQ